MKKEKTLCLLFIVFVAFFFANEVFAEDLYLNTQLESDYYQSDDDIVAQDGCEILQGRWVWFVAGTGAILEPGFHVESGAIFGLVIGGYEDLPKDLDYDEDGLADWWELYYFGDLDEDCGDDYDGDGFSNCEEYFLGSNPDAGPGSVVAHAIPVVPDFWFGYLTDEQLGGGGLVGDSVRIISGNVVETREDLSFSSPNRLGLSFRATYNSQSDTVGILGYGWTHTYSVSLDTTFLGSPNPAVANITDENGRPSYFGRMPNGEFISLLEEKTTLKSEGGGYVWYRLDGTK